MAKKIIMVLSLLFFVSAFQVLDVNLSQDSKISERVAISFEAFGFFGLERILADEEEEKRTKAKEEEEEAESTVKQGSEETKEKESKSEEK
jgi:hypothetical protein